MTFLTRAVPARRLLAGAALLTSWLLPAATAASASRLNLVLILADDLGQRDVGYEGHPLHETPHIDRLAASGMRFSDAYSACGVCSPTRAAIMTGKYPGRLRLTTHIRPDNGPHPRGKLKTPDSKLWLEAEEVTVAEALRDAGYACASIGKWHLGEQNGAQYRPQNQGFSRVVLSQQHGFFEYFHPFVDQKKWPYAGPLPGKKGDYLPDRLTDEALVFIEENRNRPFFLYLSHWSPHNPLEAKPDMIARYERKLQAAPGSGNATYAAMVESLDESVGRVLAKLDALGLGENTLVIFTSDNGAVTDNGRQSSVGPYRGSKSHYYGGGIRVPLAVRWPGVTAPGSLSRTPVISTDFFPTMLEAAGIPLRPQDHRDGVSLVPLLRGGAGLPRESLFWHFPHYHSGGGQPCGAVRAGRWKLLEFFERDAVELYDLQADPGERHNLASAQPARAATLRQTLVDWRASIRAAMPARP